MHGGPSYPDLEPASNVMPSSVAPEEPSGSLGDPALARRRQLTLGFGAASLLLGILSSIVHVASGDPKRAAFTTGFGLILVSCLALLRFDKIRPATVAHLILGLATIGLVASPLFGVDAIPLPIALTAVPVSAVALLGHRQSWLWTASSTLLLGSIALLAEMEEAERTLTWMTMVVTATLGTSASVIDYFRDRAEREARRARTETARAHLQRSRTEASLAEREAILATLYRRSPALLMLVDFTTGRIIEVNDRFTELLGWPREEAVGKQLSELGAWSSEHDRAAVREMVNVTGRIEALESQLQDRAGNMVPLLASVERISLNDRAHWLVHAVDVRERKRLEERIQRDLEKRLDAQGEQLERFRARLDRQEQLASVGTLAAGIAHQINNPIGGIRMIAEVARLESERGSGEGDALTSAFDRIIEESARCGDIVRSILQFSRNEPLSRWADDLNESVERAVRLVRARANAQGVKIEMQCDDVPLPVSLNPLAIDQILTNLVENAMQTTPPATSIRISTERRGETALLRIEDDGPGMARDLIDRAFDPFFTTRVDSGGTGLGLSVVHGLVRDLDGEITLESPEGTGLRAEVGLPLLATTD